MKLEFLPGGHPDRPLLRLYRFTPGEAVLFQFQLSAMAAADVERVDVHELPFVESVGGCRLTLRVSAWDAGLVRGILPANFECRLTRGTWDDVAGLVEPFSEKSSGYQWLEGADGAGLLLSVDGEW